MKQRILIVGHGYLGRHVSQVLPVDTFEITVTTRKKLPVQTKFGRSDHVIEFDVTDSSAEAITESFDSIVYSVGFDRTREHTRHQIYCEGLQNFMAKLQKSPSKFIYISSTGVYSQNDGELINEQSETNPNRESGRACLAAEEALLRFGLDSEVTILRLAGIYGPGRVPNRAKVEAGQSVDVSGFLNLIHVVDAAKIIRHFLLKPSTEGSSSQMPAYQSSIFNVSDGFPVSRNIFYREIADQLGIAKGACDSDATFPSSRATTNKKISNRKLLSETGYQFEFPNYRAGLLAALSSD